MVYIPNALCIILALFFMLFSFDVFGGSDPMWRQFVGFLIHSIPSLLLIILLLFSRKWPLAGAIAGAILFLFFTVFFKTYRDPVIFVLISIPVLLIGTLYLMVYLENNRKKRE